jgi:hypothetical protein
MADNPITLILFRRNDRVSKRASLADALLSYLEVPYGCTYRDR